MLNQQLDPIWKYSQVKMKVIIVCWCKQQLFQYNINGTLTKYAKKQYNCFNLNSTPVNNKFISIQQLIWSNIGTNHSNGNVQSKATNKNIKNKQFIAIQDSVLQILTQNAKKLHKKSNNSEYLANNKCEDNTVGDVVNKNTKHIFDTQESKTAVKHKVWIHAQVSDNDDHKNELVAFIKTCESICSSSALKE